MKLLPFLRIRKSQAGFSLIEVLVAMLILSIVALATASNTIKGFVFFKRNTRQAYASQLALDRLELLAAQDPAILAASTSSENITYRNVSFVRTTTIVANSDGSRSIEISVSGTGLGGKAMFTTTVPARGNT